MAAQYPNAYNVFVPSHEATNNLVVDFARNPKSFPLNRYVQVIPQSKLQGLYLEMTVEMAGRITTSDLSEFVWPDGNNAPEGTWNTEKHEMKMTFLQRYVYPYLLGNLTVENAEWDIIAHHGRIAAQRAMTARTQLVVTGATTTGNYDSSHVLDVTSDITGNMGNWAQSTTARQDIKRSLNTAAELIMKDTLSAVEPENLILVISVPLARELAETQEIVDYVKGSPEAYNQVKGDSPNQNKYFGLPATLYGYEVVIENTYKVTTVKGATTSRSPVLAKATPFMCSRVGALEGLEGGPNFTTHCLFTYEEMQTEVKNDVDNRRTLGRVVDTIGSNVVAPVSGVMFQAVA